jgi:3',5'-cyclic AMP phosphodiesterase CpdA
MGGTIVDRSDGAEIDLPALVIAEPPASLSPRLRLISSPDFLNADVGDLRRGVDFWDPTSFANSINGDYRRTVDAVLDDWEAADPDAVLVAGDLVEGRWGIDDLGSGTFGPVDTLPEQLDALHRAADIYYPQYARWFKKHHLQLFPAMGDHEYGDNPWPPGKRARASAFREEFAEHFTRTPDGAPRFADHPPGPHAWTAYAGRPAPDVQVITIDPFDITPARAKLRLDPQQRSWLRDVLRRARRDQVRWIIVQGHLPILGPVRARGSSELYLDGGATSGVWRMFEKYGVDLYLSGEAHDVTVLERGGVTQITHGGRFAGGLTTALMLDFYDDYIYVTLRDYDIHEEHIGPLLWQTRANGLPGQIEMREPPSTIGTGVVPDTGGLRLETGILVPGLS